MPEVVSVGETLIRLSAPQGYSLENAARLCVHVAGAESNVAIGLARLGHRTSYMTVVPDNPLGRLVAGEVRRHGADTGGIVFAPEGRAGLYFLELGAAPRANRVVYDRAGSAFANARPDDLPWDLLDGARVLHTSGITAAVNAGLAARAVSEARARGVAVSLDLNYRHKLWQPAVARATLEPLLSLVQVLFTTVEDAALVLGAEGTAEEVAAVLQQRYGVSVAVVTDGGRGAVAATNAGILRESGYAVEALDRIGAGDACVAGFLSGWLRSGVALGLQQGVAMAALKHTYLGDVPWVSDEDLGRLVNGQREGWR